MREIKFRVWDNDTKKMYDKSGLMVGDNIVSAVNGSIMQYTGYSDISNRFIYEGDIIDRKFKWIVEFEDGCFYAKNQYGKAYLLHDIIRKRRIAGSPIEVIGNIHQNPELI